MLQYVYLVADHYLHRRQASAARAFRSGLHSTIEPAWLALFDARELQRLIAGDEQPIDVDDWQRHAVYDARADPRTGPDHRVQFKNRYCALNTPFSRPLFSYICQEASLGCDCV